MVVFFLGFSTGVSCDSCSIGNFRGKRFKCLICYDYDLCATCYENGATTTRHTADHPMQCILTRTDFGKVNTVYADCRFFSYYLMNIILLYFSFKINYISSSYFGVVGLTQIYWKCVAWYSPQFFRGYVLLKFAINCQVNLLPLSKDLIL